MRFATRRGTAVVAALGLVTLAAALLASAAMASAAGARAVLLERAGLVAECVARGVLAESLTAWDVAADSMAIGGVVEGAFVERAGDAGAPPTVARVRRQRLGPGLYALSVEVRVGGAVTLARRRVRLFVRRAGDADSAAHAGPLVPLGRWRLADLH